MGYFWTRRKSPILDHFFKSRSYEKKPQPQNARSVLESASIFWPYKFFLKGYTSVTNKYFSNPELIDAAKLAIKLMENEEDVWCRNSSILREFLGVAESLRNAVIETESETEENSAFYWDNIDRRQRVYALNALSGKSVLAK